MSTDLTGQTALVTGGAKRLGRAIALALAHAGANVVVNYRSSTDEALDLVSELKAVGVAAWAIPADLADSSDLQSLIGKAWDTAGRLDILINNASTFPATDLESVTLEGLTDSISLNAWAPFELGRQFAARAERGHIVNILDTRLIGYDWQHVSYIAAKHLLALFTRMMAVRFAPDIAVNAIAPGLILPPEGKDMAYLESLKDSLPLKRVGSPEEVARAVLYLVRSEFVTGQVVFVDGGRHLLHGGTHAI